MIPRRTSRSAPASPPRPGRSRGERDDAAPAPTSPTRRPDPAPARDAAPSPGARIGERADGLPPRPPARLRDGRTRQAQRPTPETTPRQARTVPLWGLLVIALATLAMGFASARRASAEAIDAVWLGGYAHSFNNPAGRKEAGTGEVEAEADTPKLRALRALGAPRVAFTVALNTGGKTDFGGAALVWERRLVGRLSGSVQFGLNLNDGDTHAPSGPAGDDLRRTRLQLGSKVLFREAAGLNWRLNRRLSLGLQYIHNSNGEILAHGSNESINEIGLRLGLRFGKG